MGSGGATELIEWDGGVEEGRKCQETDEQPGGEGGAGGDPPGAHTASVCAVIWPVGGAAELRGDAAVPPIGVDAALLRPTAVGPLLALIHVEALPPPLGAVPIGAVAAEPPRQILTAVAALRPPAALIHVVAAEAVGAEDESGAAAAPKGAEGVEAALSAARAHRALVHVEAGAVVGRQAEAGLAAAAEGPGGVGAAVLAQPLCALILIHALGV